MYQFRSFPSAFPRVFTRVVTALGFMLHLMGVRILLYLDVWLILAYSGPVPSFSRRGPCGLPQFSASRCTWGGSLLFLLSAFGTWGCT